MTQPLILRHTYTRSRSTARAGLRYYQMRPRGDGEPPRSLFTASGTVSRAEAYQLMDAHQGRGYLAHRLMLSPSGEMRPDDLRAFARSVMGELEKRHGRPLHWVAVEHHNTDHPHVHVVLCGGSIGRGEVRLGREDHARMRADGFAYCERDARDQRQWDETFARAAAAETQGREGHDGDRDDHDR